MFNETVASANYEITGRIDPIILKVFPVVLGFFGGFITILAAFG